MREEERTVQSMFNMWFWNFQNNSPQQFSNLYHFTIALISFFNEKQPTGEGTYDSTLKELEKVFFFPIPEMTKRHKNLNISKNIVDWNITNLELCYFRDSQNLRTKLSTPYYTDSIKVQETKKILFAELITVLSLFKAELFNVIMKILIEKKIELNIPYQASYFRPVEQIETEKKE